MGENYIAKQTKKTSKLLVLFLLLFHVAQDAISSSTQTSIDDELEAKITISEGVSLKIENLDDDKLVYKLFSESAGVARTIEKGGMASIGWNEIIGYQKVEIYEKEDDGEDEDEKLTLYFTSFGMRKVNVTYTDDDDDSLGYKLANQNTINTITSGQNIPIEKGQTMIIGEKDSDDNDLEDAFEIIFTTNSSTTNTGTQGETDVITYAFCKLPTVKELLSNFQDSQNHLVYKDMVSKELSLQDVLEEGITYRVLDKKGQCISEATKVKIIVSKKIIVRDGKKTFCSSLKVSDLLAKLNSSEGVRVMREGEKSPLSEEEFLGTGSYTLVKESQCGKEEENIVVKINSEPRLQGGVKEAVFCLKSKVNELLDMLEDSQDVSLRKVGQTGFLTEDEFLSTGKYEFVRQNECGEKVSYVEVKIIQKLTFLEGVQTTFCSSVKMSELLTIINNSEGVSVVKEGESKPYTPSAVLGEGKYKIVKKTKCGEDVLVVEVKINKEPKLQEGKETVFCSKPTVEELLSMLEDSKGITLLKVGEKKDFSDPNMRLEAGSYKAVRMDACGGSKELDIDLKIDAPKKPKLKEGVITTFQYK